MTVIDQSPITMQEIAERASVSLSTVSCVLNEKRKGVWIGEKTRRRVLETAAALGYQPNDLARAIVSGKNHMLGFLGFHAMYEAAARMLGSAIDEAEAQGYTVKVLSTNNASTDSSTIDQCIRLRLAGVIVMLPGEQDLTRLRTEMARYRIPVALVDNSKPFNWGIRIVSDDRQGAGLAVEHLAGLGHRRIAFVSTSNVSPMIIDRESGYRSAMERLGLTVGADNIAHAEWNAPGIDRTTRQFFIGHQDAPTAIVCPTDSTAMIVIRTLRRIGLRVPDDVSVVGFADLTMAELCDPPLTTVAQPFEEMGRSVVRHLLTRVQQGKASHTDEPIEDLMPTHLVVRESTGPVPLTA